MPYKDIDKRKKAQKEYASKNKEKFNGRRHILRERNRDFIKKIKEVSKCSRCGESDIRCLDFHHIDEETKTKDICRLVLDASSISKIQEEINKCEILCANCHRKLHH